MHATEENAGSLKKNYKNLRRSLVNRFLAVVTVIILYLPHSSSGFALLTHQAIIDATWDKSIKPLLLQKYPGATAEELKKAHAHVYGGSIVADIGYYPFGSIMFSHLLHYVRSGDFVVALLDEAQNINEYGFALGMYCHYNADKYGHAMGTNLAVPVLFPKAKEKYGDVVTYEQDRSKHIRTEFGFDVIQTAKGNYDKNAIHDFIGFEVSQPLLERAFLKTYGFDLKEIFTSFPVAMGTFRFVVKQLFPRLSRDAWKVRKSFITKLNPLADKKTYTYKMDRRTYKKEFGKLHLTSPLISLIILVLPKVGPFTGLKFKEPGPEGEKLFDESFTAIVNQYSASLKRLQSEKPSIENIDYDTGKKTTPGEYKLADKSYYKLLKKLKRKKFEAINPALKENLIAFYSNPKTEKVYYKNPRTWKKISKAMLELRATEPVLNAAKIK